MTAQDYLEQTIVYAQEFCSGPCAHCDGSGCEHCKNGVYTPGVLDPSLQAFVVAGQLSNMERARLKEDFALVMDLVQVTFEFVKHGTLKQMAENPEESLGVLQRTKEVVEKVKSGGPRVDVSPNPNNALSPEELAELGISVE